MEVLSPAFGNWDVDLVGANSRFYFGTKNLCDARDIRFLALNKMSLNFINANTNAQVISKNSSPKTEPMCELPPSTQKLMDGNQGVSHHSALLQSQPCRHERESQSNFFVFISAAHSFYATLRFIHWSANKPHNPSYNAHKITAHLYYTSPASVPELANDYHEYEALTEPVCQEDEFHQRRFCSNRW